MKLQNKDFDLRQLEIFCKIVESGSFSKAARELYLAQPTVSEHMANLESVLDLRLLDRKGKKIAVTPAGKLLYSQAIKILKMKKELLRTMNDFTSQAKGSLILAASSIPGSYVLPVLMTRFKKLYPESSITLKVLDTEEVIQAVRDGQYEIGVVGAKPKYGDIQSRILCTDQLVLIFNPEHPLAKRKSPLDPQMLSQVPFIIRERGSAQRELVEKSFAKLKVSLNVIYEMGGNEAVKETVKYGEAAAILSSRAVEREVEEGLLKTLKIKGLKFERSFYTIYHKHRTQSPVSQLFLSFLRTKEGRPS